MINEINATIRGRLGSEINYSSKSNSKPFASARVACTARYRDKNGKWCDANTEWVSVKAFGNLADNMHRSLNKGQPVIATGSLRTEEWMDREGNKRFNMVMVLDSIGHDLTWGRTAYIANKEERDEIQKSLEAQSGSEPETDNVNGENNGEIASEETEDPWQDQSEETSEDEEIDLKSRGYNLVAG